MKFVNKIISRILANCFLTAPGLFILAILISLISELLIPQGLRQEQSTDFENYYLPVAENIVYGYGLSTNDGSPAMLYPPGHPLIVAGIIYIANRSGIPADIYFNIFTIVCFGLSVVLVFLMARSIWPPNLAPIPAL